MVNPNSLRVRPILLFSPCTFFQAGFTGEASSTCFIFQSICNRGVWSVTMTMCVWSRQSTWSLWGYCPLSWLWWLMRSKTTYQPPPSSTCLLVASHCADFAKCLGPQASCSQSSHGQRRTRTNHGTTVSTSTWRWKTKMWWKRPVPSVMISQVNKSVISHIMTVQLFVNPLQEVQVAFCLSPWWMPQQSVLGLAWGHEGAMTDISAVSAGTGLVVRGSMTDFSAVSARTGLVIRVPWLTSQQSVLGLAWSWGCHDGHLRGQCWDWPGHEGAMMDSSVVSAWTGLARSWGCHVGLLGSQCWDWPGHGGAMTDFSSVSSGTGLIMRVHCMTS